MTPELDPPIKKFDQDLADAPDSFTKEEIHDYTGSRVPGRVLRIDWRWTIL